MIARDLTSKALSLSRQYPFVVITGPRQSGKKTLAKAAFPDYKKVSLEDIDIREFASLVISDFIKNDFNNGI